MTIKGLPNGKAGRRSMHSQTLMFALNEWLFPVGWTLQKGGFRSLPR